MDHFWKSALLATLDLLPFVDVVYTPNEFFPYSRKFYPLDFSNLISGRSVGFCVHKDRIHSIPPQLLDVIDSPSQIVYSNDVFIVACVKLPPDFRWFYYEEIRYREYMNLRDAVLSGALGRNKTPYWRIDKRDGIGSVLIVGATNMGNIGDDLIACAIANYLQEVNCSIYFSDFRVTRADLADFDLVIVGGGRYYLF